ncbi:flagellar motor stator protein MotA [Azospirillum sp. RWY-5-1]|uniref:Flagellar motor stator protein MotA n=1 Tax=Azospirillum oleiclasticum TaxID=2735135 RepID=A0ABX2TL54_9PROT|nr:flagellar motor stator protein MotA [Azospirillum oleiclasticum]NYZ17874.1 flagellar motor stator protein MotA [Azospirillum oleiclasticum]NYZ25082.1 flagellar motor stator protein MotA [Azospirillum oleiclasticum]
MFVMIGVGIVLFSVFGGYAMAGGHLGVLWQPFEYLIILGAAVGAYCIANPKGVITHTGKEVGHLFKGPKYKKEDYLELLTMMYQVFKIAKTKGLLALEQHIEKPEDSPLFQQFPKFYGDHHAIAFLCTYLRLMSLGADNPHELVDLMEEDIETMHHEHQRVSDAIQGVADGVPALGIVAAVLGVIHTMGSITEPPEVLGKLIGAALVGTFSGVLFAYGFFAPIAGGLKHIYHAEGKYYQCMKTGLLAHLSGYAPAISVEYARNVLEPEYRPSFAQVEEATAALPPA